MDLTRAHWKYIRDRTYKVALLPWGATEPHNLHLPFGTDSLCSQRISELTADQCKADGTGVSVLPGIPYWVNTGQLDLNMCIPIRPSVVYQILKEVAVSVFSHGVEKLIIINGHGGTTSNRSSESYHRMFPIFLHPLPTGGLRRLQTTCSMSRVITPVSSRHR